MACAARLSRAPSLEARAHVESASCQHQRYMACDNSPASLSCLTASVEMGPDTLIERTAPGKSGLDAHVEHQGTRRHASTSRPLESERISPKGLSRSVVLS